MAIFPFPFERFNFHSPLEIAVVLKRIASAIDPKPSWFGQIKQPLKGYVEKNTFAVRRVIRYNNSFLPHIRGQVTPGQKGGSNVTGVMALNVQVIIFMVFAVCPS